MMKLLVCDSDELTRHLLKIVSTTRPSERDFTLINNAIVSAELLPDRDQVGSHRKLLDALLSDSWTDECQAEYAILVDDITTWRSQQENLEILLGYSIFANAFTLESRMRIRSRAEFASRLGFRADVSLKARGSTDSRYGDYGE